MGFFKKLFEKKSCSVCENDIGLFGNRKLEDGNLCKDCAALLSPWFSDRRSSTVDEIKEQLAYRDDNKQAVAAFRTTRSLGDDTKLLLDENARKFMVTDARDLNKANPDVLNFDQVTGCELDINEDTEEEMREDKDGNEISYQPKRYRYRYNFEMIIRVNHRYFDEIRFRLNDSSIETTEQGAVIATRKPNPRLNREYLKYDNMGKEIKKILTEVREEARESEKAAAAPKVAVTCPGCGATTIPDASGCCEYCGTALTQA